MEFQASAYLRGRQVAIRLLQRPLKANEDPDGIEVETVWIRFTNRQVAAVEEEFGGVGKFDELFEDEPARTLERFFAIALGAEVPLRKEDVHAVGARMLDTEYPAYMAALETAWQLAHAMPEGDAKKVWEGRVELAQQGTEFGKKVMEKVMAEIVKELEKQARGGNGSKRGRSRAGPSMSSGS